MAASRQRSEFILGCFITIMTIMTICELGKEWEDPTKIPVDEIVTEWREQSSKGRYEVAVWRGLEEPNAKGAKGAKEGADADAEMEVDNLAAGGFFGWMDVISSGPGEGEGGCIPSSGSTQGP